MLFYKTIQNPGQKISPAEQKNNHAISATSFLYLKKTLQPL